MQKACRVLVQVAGRFLFIGISVQILLGICWGVRAFGLFPEFGDSYLWLKAADTLVCDDYMGIGYPLFLVLAKGIEFISSIPYTFFVYLIQLAVAFCSSVRFLRSFGIIRKKWMFIWGSLGMLTYPMAMQCHLAVLPNSIGFSCMLLELAAIIRILKSGSRSAAEQATGEHPLYAFTEAIVWWVAGTVFVAENLYLGLVPLIVLWILHLIQVRQLGKQRILKELAVLFVMGGILFAVVPAWQTPGSYGKAENTVSAAMMRRFSWTHMREGKEYDALPEELREYLSLDDFRSAGYYPGTMQSGIQKTWEETVGKQEAQKMFWTCAVFNLKTYASDNIHQIVWDCAGYTLPPVLLQMLLDGRGYESFSGRNVDIMMTGALKLTNILLKYSSWWYLMGIPAMFLIVIGRRIIAVTTGEKKNNTGKSAGGKILFVCIVTSGCMILWYAMQDAGCLDYKNGLLPGSLWLVGMILSMGSLPAADGMGQE